MLHPGSTITFLTESPFTNCKWLPANLILHIQVSVEVLEDGFLISVFMDKNSPGLLASILKAFDVLGLTVLEARASCASSFRLQAVGGEVFRMIHIKYFF